ncbi:MAG: LptF/LptG family permease, partial [Pseudomonadota bacterium]
MRTITRYVAFEFLTVFAITLAGITVFMLLVGVGREAVREGLSFGPLMRIMPFIVPVSMRFSIPAAALLAACAVFGRMSGENEVVAVKSMGISPQAIISPVLVLSFLISIFAVWINDVAVSWGRPGVSRVITESIEQIAYGWLRTQRYFKRDNFSIQVRRVEGDRLILPIVTFFAEEEANSATIIAREAVLRRDPESSRLVISLRDASVENQSFEGALPGKNEWELDLEQHLNGDKVLSPSDLALNQLAPEREMSRQRVNQLSKALAVDAAHALLTGDFGSLNSIFAVWIND